ncbi:MAG: type 4a pilus biogenesis protein PilN [Gammaproteobacteria bacterium]|nr:MAG: type 4a pilus biogenesis protein PilN [Gammaproteobacteria bacterium]
MRRKEQDKQLLSLMVFVSVLMGLAVFYAHLHVGGLIDNQNARNNFLNEKIAQVDKQIKEIRDIKKRRAALISRMNIIYRLQGDRTQVVHLFDELVQRLPEGVYLKSLEQKSKSVKMKGVAQSNARVSALMRNLEESNWFTRPNLKVINVKKNKKTGDRVSNFDLSVTQTDKSAKKKSTKKKSGKTPKAAKAKAGRKK